MPGKSRNDVFSESFSMTPPPSPGRSRAVSSATSSIQRTIPIINPPSREGSATVTSQAGDFEHGVLSQNVDLATVKPSPSLRVRLSSTQLGLGRHAVVRLASYRSHEKGGNNSSSDGDWQICAAKRMAADKESQVAGLNEAFMLSRLKECRQILRFIGLKDEHDHAAPLSRRPSASPGLDTVATSSAPPSSNGNSRSVPSSPVLELDPRHFAGPRIAAGSLSPGDARGPSAANSELLSASNLRRAVSVKHDTRVPSKLSSAAADRGFTVEGRSDAEIPRLVILTEFCLLGNLANFVRDHGRKCLGSRMFFKLAADLLSAIDFLHLHNVIHADVKPQNCMIDQAFNLKLGDFSSSLFATPTLTDGIGIGTTSYSPPELARPAPSPFSFPVDIFSSGLTLLFMITGVEPYETLTRHQKEQSLSRGSRRRVRTSSGASSTIELHLYLLKGYAWEWQEQHRLEDLEDAQVDSQPHVSSPSLWQDGSNGIRLRLKPLDTAELELADDRQLPYHVDVPESLLENDRITVTPASHVHRHVSPYEDGSPAQFFLHGAILVSEALRSLVRSMLAPESHDRPSAQLVKKSLHRCMADRLQLQ